MMQLLVRPRVAGILGAGMFAVACGDSSSPASPSPAPPAATTAVLLTLSGIVADDAGTPVSGAIVTVVDGSNAGNAALTDSAGRYSLANLSAGGFSIRVRRDGFDDLVREITLTSTLSLDVRISPSRVNLSGALDGTFAYTFPADGATFRAVWPMTATVTQSGTAISGTLLIQTTPGMPQFDWTGSFTGTLSSVMGITQYSGSLTITGLINTGNGRCNGTRSDTAGSATSTRLTLSAPGLWRWDECISTREDVVITLNKTAPAGPRSR